MKNENAKCKILPKNQGQIFFYMHCILGQQAIFHFAFFIFLS